MAFHPNISGSVSFLDVTVLGTLTVGSLNGVLKANAGVVSGGATTTDLPEGSNLYFTSGRFNTAFAAKSTSDLTEGTNQYFTTARARTSISATTPVSYDSSTGVVSFDVATVSLTKYVLKAGDSMTGQLSITPATDVTALILKAGGTSTSAFTLQAKDSSDTAWFYIRKHTLSDPNIGCLFDFATANGTAGARSGMVINVGPGYTGGEFTGALGFDSTVAGTATYYTADATVYGYRPSGNRGIGGFSRGVTTGHNIGGMFIAGGGAVNYGVWGSSTITKSGGSNVGVVGVAANASVTNPGAIGVYATLYNSGTMPPNMGNIKVALLVDNQAFTDPIAIFRTNGSIIASIEDAGDFLLGDRTSTTNLGTRFRVPASITTTDATVTTLESYTTATGTSYTVHSTVTAVKSDGTVMGSFVIYVAVKNNAGTVTVTDGPNFAQNYGGGVGLAATIDISGTTFRVRVTGVAATNIRWQNQFRISAVKY